MVTCMPAKDRKAILKELKHPVSKRRRGSVSNGLKVVVGGVSNSSDTSQALVSNDWPNWVSLHGNEEVVVEDGWGIGKTISVKFNGDNVNPFNVLSQCGWRHLFER